MISRDKLTMFGHNYFFLIFNNAFRHLHLLRHRNLASAIKRLRMPISTSARLCGTIIATNVLCFLYGSSTSPYEWMLPSRSYMLPQGISRSELFPPRERSEQDTDIHSPITRWFLKFLCRIRSAHPVPVHRVAGHAAGGGRLQLESTSRARGYL
jgi:hypothetical protein